MNHAGRLNQISINVNYIGGITTNQTKTSINIRMGELTNANIRNIA